MEVDFNLYGPRDYVDIAQVSYRVLEALGQTPLPEVDFSFAIRIERPVGATGIIQSASDVSDKDKIWAQFNITNAGIKKDYVLLEKDPSLPAAVADIEPSHVESIDYKVSGDEIHWLTKPAIEWSTFYAFMLMGRLSGIHFFGGTKPRGLSYEMKRIPTAQESSQLWVRKVRGPIKGIGVIELLCADEVIGFSILKI